MARRKGRAAEIVLPVTFTAAAGEMVGRADTKIHIQTDAQAGGSMEVAASVDDGQSGGEVARRDAAVRAAFTTRCLSQPPEI